MAVFVAAVTYNPLSVKAYNFVASPNNLLTDGSDYATLQYATSIVCPLGGFSKYPGAPNNFCIHNTSGAIIGGWEVVNFNNYTGYNTTTITVIGTDLSPSYTTTVKVFKTGVTYGNSTVWTYVGDCNFAVGSNHSTCNLNTSLSPVGNVLLGRFSGGSFRGNPGVNFVQISG